MSGCTFSGDSISATHPLLGDISIRRGAIAHLIRPADDAAPAPTPPKDRP
jgi:hypothetical protein